MNIIWITRQHISNVKVNTVYQNYVGTVIQGYTNTPKRCGFLNLRTGIRVVKFRFLVDVLEQCLPLPLTLLTVCHALCICPHNIGRPKFLCKRLPKILSFQAKVFYGVVRE